MFQKALIPIDGSPASIKAVTTVKRMIKEGSIKEVALLHVVANQSEVMLVNGMHMPNLYEEATQAAKQILTSARDVLGPQIQATLLLENGSPAEVICQIAERDNCDLVVIGDRGLNRLQRFLLGSVSNKVTMQAHCSVLVVK